MQTLSHRRARPLRAIAALAASSLLVVSVTACSGAEAEGESETSGKDPEEVLALAKTTLDETSGVVIGLNTNDLPDGINGLSKASGVGTPDPAAFEGSITVILLGSPVDVPVVGVDGKVYAIVPLTTGYQEVDPSEYGAPDPGKLLSSDAGFSSLLTATTDVEEGDAVRGRDDNSEVLTEYTGTVPDTVAKNVIPSAAGQFDATYGITDEGELREVKLTGDFYGEAAGASTYTITFASYGMEKEITAP